MIPENVVTSVKDAFDAYYQARSEQLDREIRIAENQLTLDGLGNSTAVADRFRELYRDALRDCLSKLLRSFEDTLNAYNSESRSELSQPILDVIHGSLQPIASDFNQRLDRAANNAGVPLHKNLDDEVIRLHTEAKVEVDLLLGRLAKPAAIRRKYDESQEPLEWLKGKKPIGLLVALSVIVIGISNFRKEASDLLNWGKRSLGWEESQIDLKMAPSNRKFLAIMVSNNGNAPGTIGRVVIRYHFKGSSKSVTSNAQTLEVQDFEKGGGLLKPGETKQLFLSYADEKRKETAMKYASDFSDRLFCTFEVEVVNFDGTTETKKLPTNCRTCCAEYFRLNNQATVTIPPDLSR